VLGLSVDSKHCLKAWAESLGGITYPLLSDFYPHGEIAQRYGVLRAEGYSERAIFIIDKPGIIRYVDVHDIDEQPDNEQLFEVLEELEAAAGRGPAHQPPPVVESSPEPRAEVVLYCTPWCPECRRVRLFLEEHGVPYEEVNIMKDRGGAARVRAWTGGYETTPTLNIRGTIIVNFKRELVKEALGIRD
jgi:glutaredoxin